MLPAPCWTRGDTRHPCAFSSSLKPSWRNFNIPVLCPTKQRPRATGKAAQGPRLGKGRGRNTQKGLRTVRPALLPAGPSTPAVWGQGDSRSHISPYHTASHSLTDRNGTLRVKPLTWIPTRSTSDPIPRLRQTMPWGGQGDDSQDTTIQHSSAPRPRGWGPSGRGLAHLPLTCAGVTSAAIAPRGA